MHNHSFGFGAVCFFDLGCFLVVVWLWEDVLRHKLYMVAMLGVVGVVVGECISLRFCSNSQGLFCCIKPTSTQYAGKGCNCNWCWGARL
jgi:hypothetical protein